MTSPIILREPATDVEATLRHALAQRELVDEIALDAAKNRISRVVFTGVGGSWASSIPASRLLSSLPSPLSVLNLNATDLTMSYLPTIDRSTLVVASSHSGGTPETVAAAEVARNRGALVVSLARDSSNPLSDTAAHQLTYNSDSTITAAKYLLLDELCYALFDAFGVSSNAEEARSALDGVPTASANALAESEPELASIAARFALSECIQVLGAGSTLGLAYMLSVCYLVEMQWKVSAHFSAADFLHGPFEIAQQEMPYIVIAGEDSSRPQIDRVRSFFNRHHDSYALIDSAALTLDGVANSWRGAVSHIALSSIVARLLDHFEPITGHNLETRAYMHRVEY